MEESTPQEQPTNESVSPQTDIGQNAVKPRRKEEKGSKKRLIIIIGIVLIILGSVWFFFFRNTDDSVESNTVVIEDTNSQREETPTPKPTSEPIDKSKITIEILNGTGIAKEASFLEEKLLNLNYEIIETGNASEQDNESATVTFDSNLAKDIVDELTELFENTYQNLNVKNSSSQSVDVRITTGLRSGQSLPTATPKASPTPLVTDAPSPTASPSATPAP